jgi:hypothetical protein
MANTVSTRRAWKERKKRLAAAIEDGGAVDARKPILKKNNRSDRI